MRTATIIVTYTVEETFDVPDGVEDVKTWSIAMASRMSNEHKEWTGTMAVDENDEELWSC